MEQWVNSYKKIIEFAIGHEVKAYQLYIDLSKMMVHSTTRKFCKELAKEELGHTAKLEKENARKCKLISPVNLSKYEIAKGNVNIFANCLSMLSFAIKKEQAAVELYRDLAELTKNEDVRQMFMWLAEEELNHKRQVALEHDEFLK